MRKEITEKINGISLFDTYVTDNDITYYYKQARKRIYVPLYANKYINKVGKPTRNSTYKEAYDFAVTLHKMNEEEYDCLCRGILNHLLKVIGQTLLTY